MLALILNTDNIQKQYIYNNNYSAHDLLLSFYDFCENHKNEILKCGTCSNTLYSENSIKNTMCFTCSNNT